MSQNKMTREQKGKAVDIAIQGGNPLEYLKKMRSEESDSGLVVHQENAGAEQPEAAGENPGEAGDGAG